MHVRVPLDLLAGVDAWIAEEAARMSEPRTISRPEALRLLASEALTTMGLMPPRKG